MIVRELIKQLKGFDGDLLVVISRDSEGNGFVASDRIGFGAYRDGKVGLERLTEQDKAKGYTEDDVIKDGKPCIVLWP